jgi:hypothetical protein
MKFLNFEEEIHQIKTSPSCKNREPNTSSSFLPIYSGLIFNKFINNIILSQNHSTPLNKIMLYTDRHFEIFTGIIAKLFFCSVFSAEHQRCTIVALMRSTHELVNNHRAHRQHGNYYINNHNGLYSRITSSLYQVSRGIRTGDGGAYLDGANKGLRKAQSLE